MAFIQNRTSTSYFLPGPQDVIRTLRKWHKRHQKRGELTVLLSQEEWVLKDMGITRGDVRAALAFKGDPSLHLRALAARRRFWATKREKV